MRRHLASRCIHKTGTGRPAALFVGAIGAESSKSGETKLALRRCSRWVEALGVGSQAQAAQYRADDIGLRDGRDDRAVASALVALEYIDRKDAAQKFCPLKAALSDRLKPRRRWRRLRLG